MTSNNKIYSTGRRALEYIRNPCNYMFWASFGSQNTPSCRNSNPFGRGTMFLVSQQNYRHPYVLWASRNVLNKDLLLMLVKNILKLLYLYSLKFKDYKYSLNK